MSNDPLLSYSQHLLETLKIPQDKQIITESIIDKAKQIQTLALEKKYIPRFPIYSLHSKISYSFMPAVLQKVSKFLGAIVSIALELLFFIFIEPFRIFYNNYHEKKRQKMQENYLSQIKNEHMTRIQESKKDTPFREPTPPTSQPLLPSTQNSLKTPGALIESVHQLLQKKEDPSSQKDSIAEALGQSVLIVKSKKANFYADIALKALTEHYPNVNEYSLILQKIFFLMIDQRKKHNCTPEAISIDKNDLLNKLKENFPKIDPGHLKLLIFFLLEQQNILQEGYAGFEKIFNLFLTTMLSMQNIIANNTFIKTKTSEIHALMNEPLQERHMYASSSSSSSSSSNDAQIAEIQNFFTTSLSQGQNPYVISITCKSPSCLKINASLTNQTYIPPDQLDISFMNVESTAAAGPPLFGKANSHTTEKTLDFPIKIEYKDKNGQLIIRFSVTVECSIKEQKLSAIIKEFNFPDV